MPCSAPEKNPNTLEINQAFFFFTLKLHSDDRICFIKTVYRQMDSLWKQWKKRMLCMSAVSGFPEDGNQVSTGKCVCVCVTWIQPYSKCMTWIQPHSRCVTWPQPHSGCVTWIQPYSRCVTWIQPVSYTHLTLPTKVNV